MGKRGKQPWSREKLPVGTVRIRQHSKRCRVRMIKIRDDGPKGRRWITLARYWWLQNRGPIPPGMRVIHADGDVLNDHPSNYKLATADDVLMLSRQWDPTLDARNHRAAAQATAKVNGERSRVERASRLFSGSWYAVDPTRAVIINEPHRSRVEVVRRHFNARVAAINGKGLEAVCLGWPDLSGIQAEIMAALSSCEPATLATIRSRVARARWLHDWGVNPQEPAYYSAMTGLYHLGWIESRRERSRGRKRYAITSRGSASRGPSCTVIALRGRDVRERFPRADMVWPERYVDVA